MFTIKIRHHIQTVYSDTAGKLHDTERACYCVPNFRSGEAKAWNFEIEVHLVSFRKRIKCFKKPPIKLLLRQSGRAAEKQVLPHTIHGVDERSRQQ